MLSLTLLLVAAPAALAQVRILYQNDLGLESTATSALFLSEPVAGSDASAACAVYNEQPLATITNDLKDQLNYLVFRGQLSNSSEIHVGGGSSASLRFKRQASCEVYNIGFGLSSSGDCTKTLPVLCTNSAPPTSYPNSTGPTLGSEVTAGSGNASFLGYRDARSFRYLGIPFARPPVGNLRFAAAQPYNATYSNYSSLAFSASCIQDTDGGLGSFGTATLSEDCLYLNVYTPVLPTGRNASKLNVAFWIFGGAFTSGSATVPTYDGGNMVSRGDVVVVTANYRLGALGNLASSTLNGSQGITDQIQALKWIQQHISSFGGDPDQVTIFGESAGGQSVLALLSSTPAKGLFNKAISESAPWNPFFTREVSIQGVYPAILNATGCSTDSGNAAELSCLRSVNASIFLANETKAQVSAGTAIAQRNYSQAPLLIAAVEPWLPTYGTGIIDGLFNRLVSSGRLPTSGIPLMIGNMQNEAVLFVESVPQLMNPLPATTAILDLLLSQSFDNSTSTAIMDNDALFAFNTSSPDALRQLAGQLTTLDTWQCPLQQVLEIADQQKTFSALYSYRFDRGASQSQVGAIFPKGCTANSVSGYDAVCHAEDVPLVWGTNNIYGTLTPFDYNGAQQYSQYVQDVWTAFMRTGNPQPNAAYLAARGFAYSATLQYSQAAAFGEYAGNSSTSIHVMDSPPRNSAPFYLEQCSVLQNAGFLYQNVQ